MAWPAFCQSSTAWIPTALVALLLGMIAVIHSADTFSSILLGVPGSSGSQATVLDGYPLARRGEAARAFGAAFLASLIGGTFGAIILFFFLPIARPLVLTFDSPELFMLSICAGPSACSNTGGTGHDLRRRETHS